MLQRAAAQRAVHARPGSEKGGMHAGLQDATTEQARVRRPPSRRGAPGTLRPPGCPRSWRPRCRRSARARARPGAPAPPPPPPTCSDRARPRRCCTAPRRARRPAARSPPAPPRLRGPPAVCKPAAPLGDSSGPGARNTKTGALRRPAPARSGRPAATSAATRLALRARTVATKLSCSDVASVAGQPIVLKKEQSMPSPLPSPTRSRSWYTCSARSAVQSGARHSACCAIASDASYCTYSARCSGGGGRTHRRGPVGAVHTH